MPKRPPACGKTFDDIECTDVGDHLCKPRSAHIQAFFSEILVHTKGRWSRQPFHLHDWQVADIMEPLFAQVTWSDEFGRYVRRYRLAWIEVARKNGKSELLAGIALYLLVADDEEGAEIYGCVDPQTPVLCDDLTWRPISELRKGDKIVALDEEPPAPGENRKLRAATVLNSWPTRKESVRITFDNGKSIVCSTDHRWLSTPPNGNLRGWRKTSQMGVGYRVLDIVDPWTVGDSRDHGYLAGLFDGEGSFHAPLRRGAAFRADFTQKPGLVLDEFRAAMKRIDMPVSYSRLNCGKSGVYRETVTGLRDTLRLLGEVRPARLLARHHEVWEGRHPGKDARMARIESIEPLGERDLWDIETTSGTYLAEGLVSHNCAVDRDQARKVYDVAERMVQLSPILSARLKINKQAKRIYDTSTGSYYEALASDAGGNLGHNPHGIVFDEVLTQKNADLWNAMRTGMGARDQPLMVAATTAGADPQSFGKAEHDEMQKIFDDPERARHILVYLRNLPADADPWDETLWPLANPALGQFLSLQSLRDEAQEAKNDPGKENAFRQFRLNQWVSQSSRWMPMHLWDRCTGDLWLTPQWHNRELRGRTAYAGFDLAAKFDLTAWALVIPGDEPKEDPAHIMWRFWLPESGLERLDQFHDGRFSRWAKQGWLTITDGSVIDYDKVIDDIAEDAKEFRIVAADCDEWSMWPIINRVGDALNLSIEEGELTAYRNTYDRMSPGMTDLMGTVKRGLLRHHGNPVARFCFDQCEVRMAPYDPNLIRPEKPERARDKARIDAVPAAAMAVNAWKSREGVDPYRSAYEDGQLMVI